MIHGLGVPSIIRLRGVLASIAVMALFAGALLAAFTMDDE
jgi:hypothetical protein